MEHACRSGLAVVATLGLLTAAGCGGDTPEPASPDVSGPARLVADAVGRLERTVRAHDYETICAELLTAAARRRAGGARCPRTLRESVGEPRGARIRVLSIALDGPRAEARVRSRARGQTPVDETLQLEREGRDYRIAALAP